ncbi:uncharacterized protein LOC141909189 [Tubulanus polymorphus]|uniref:uncharacterized protein LOC141909189 n=1 Tax=Tubulanus polymorphus TaxID=672921 RepID=UPI003DA22791
MRSTYAALLLNVVSIVTGRFISRATAAGSWYPRNQWVVQRPWNMWTPYGPRPGSVIGYNPFFNPWRRHHPAADKSPGTGPSKPVTPVPPPPSCPTVATQQQIPPEGLYNTVHATDQLKSIETAHPYKQGDQLQWLIYAPNGKKIDFSFSTMKTDCSNTDVTYQLDGPGSQAQQVCGSLDGEANTSTGNLLIVKFKAKGPNDDDLHGFTMLFKAI